MLLKMFVLRYQDKMVAYQVTLQLSGQPTYHLQQMQLLSRSTWPSS